LNKKEAFYNIYCCSFVQ